MQKFDDEYTAKEAIATSPDVTQSVVDSLDEGLDNSECSDKAVNVAANVGPSPEDARNSRLLSLITKNAVSMFGAPVNDDQLSAAEEIACEGFCGLSAINPPRWLKIFITGSLLIGSFLPTGLVAYAAWKGEKNGNG